MLSLLALAVGALAQEEPVFPQLTTPGYRLVTTDIQPGSFWDPVSGTVRGGACPLAGNPGTATKTVYPATTEPGEPEPEPFASATSFVHSRMNVDVARIVSQAFGLTSVGEVASRVFAGEFRFERKTTYEAKLVPVNAFTWSPPETFKYCCRADPDQCGDGLVTAWGDFRLEINKLKSSNVDLGSADRYKEESSKDSMTLRYVQLASPEAKFDPLENRHIRPTPWYHVVNLATVERGDEIAAFKVNLPAERVHAKVEATRTNPYVRVVQHGAQVKVVLEEVPTNIEVATITLTASDPYDPDLDARRTVEVHLVRHAPPRFPEAVEPPAPFRAGEKHDLRFVVHNPAGMEERQPQITLGKAPPNLVLSGTVCESDAGTWTCEAKVDARSVQLEGPEDSELAVFQLYYDSVERTQNVTVEVLPPPPTPTEAIAPMAGPASGR